MSNQCLRKLGSLNGLSSVPGRRSKEQIPVSDGICETDDFMTLLVIVSVSLALLPVLMCEEKCTLYELQRCLESLQSVTQGNDLALVTTRLELIAVCSTLKDSVGCVDEHMKHCFTPTQRKVFNHVVAGARQFLIELCVPGPIQEDYLQHASCYKNVSTSEEKCAPMYRRLIEISGNVDQKRNVDEGLRESCCAFDEFVLCKFIHVTRDCGQEAADFLQQHLDRISSPLIHEHCAHYTYAEDSCRASSSTRTHLICLHVILLALLSLLQFFSLTDRQLSGNLRN